jgi:hypothetical protein
LNQQVKRNCERFPEDFVFQLTLEETRQVRPKPRKQGGHGHRPHAFTELGAGMLGSVLRGNKAARITVEVLRAFAREREAPMSNEARRARSILDSLTDVLIVSAKELAVTTQTRVTYFVQAGTDGPIKIGSTQNLAARFRGLQMMSPLELRLLGVAPVDIEDECHRLLARWRIHGEWFAPVPQVLQLIRERATAKAADLEC